MTQRGGRAFDPFRVETQSAMNHRTIPGAAAAVEPTLWANAPGRGSSVQHSSRHGTCTVPSRRGTCT
eukprot:5570310-Amphidinium_carterae.1